MAFNLKINDDNSSVASSRATSVNEIMVMPPINREERTGDILPDIKEEKEKKRKRRKRGFWLTPITAACNW